LLGKIYNTTYANDFLTRYISKSTKEFTAECITIDESKELVITSATPSMTE